MDTLTSCNDRVLFERLFSRSHQRTFHVALRLTGNEVDAEDLTQDAYLRAWMAFDRYNPRCCFEVWLLKILSNIAIDNWRKKSLIRTVSLDQTYQSKGNNVHIGTLVPDKKPSPEEQVIHRVQCDQIQRTLNLLPDNYRTAIILVDVEQWSYEEAALKMHCPVGTIRSRLHRGRLLLRGYLETTTYT